MKILMVAPANSTHTIKWVNSLLNSGVKIVLFSLSKCTHNQFIKSKKFEMVDLDYKQGLSTSAFRKLGYFLAIGKFRQVLKRCSADILHCHYATSAGIFSFFSGNISTIISVWGSDVYDFPRKSYFHKILLKLILSSADLICSTSHCMKKITERYTDKDIRVIPFGVDLRRFSRSGDSRKFSGELIIGTVKLLDVKYGIKYLIQAFAKLLHAPSSLKAKLYIVGDGPEKSNLRNLAIELNIEEHVTFTGFIENSSVSDYYNKFDIAVFPSIFDSESFGVSAVEAGASCLPAICSDVDGFKEVVVNEETGLIVKRKSSQEIYLALKRLIINPNFSRDLGVNARARCVEFYDFENNTKDMLNTYKELIEVHNNGIKCQEV